ncbi:MAG: CFI-box-CTERM domain-containing protein, partial [Patescibacteria group bacterium]
EVRTMPEDTSGYNRSRDHESGHESKDCFIATATYGTYMASEVQLLQRYRDERLIKTWSGRLFISLYNHFSSPAAKAIARSKLARSLVRQLLTPFVAFAKWRLSR